MPNRLCKRSLVQDEQDVGGRTSTASRAYVGTSASSLPQFLSAAAEQSQTQGLVQQKALAGSPAGVRGSASPLRSS